MTQPFSSEIHYAHGYESSHHAMFWQSEPDAFAAIAHVEVVCHKQRGQRL
ncbi:MAG: hypothetical protein R2867_08880 [Caldilineaceae bacterium]